MELHTLTRAARSYVLFMSTIRFEALTRVLTHMLIFLFLQCVRNSWTIFTKCKTSRQKCRNTRTDTHMWPLCSMSSSRNTRVHWNMQPQGEPFSQNLSVRQGHLRQRCWLPTISPIVFSHYQALDRPLHPALKCPFASLSLGHLPWVL